MNRIFKPHWIFVCTVIPVLILILMNVWQYQIIHSLLPEESLEIWKKMALVFSLFVLITAIYGLYLIVKKRDSSIIYSFVLIPISIALIWYYYSNDQLIYPRSLPRWMFSRDFVTYIFTFLMPSLALSLFQIVIYTVNGVDDKAYKSFIFVVGIPFVWYICGEIINRFTDYKFTNEYWPLLMTLTILSVIFFLYFLIRTVWIFVRSKSVNDEKSYLYLKIILTILLPLTGLLINNGIFLDLASKGNGVFGDFHTFWFYFLTFINGFLLCLPQSKKLKFRLTLFFLRSLTFSFTFYFFLIFLPFLPVSIFAILALGAGFLMLCPIVLFITHVNSLIQDVDFLKSYYSSWRINILFLSGVLVIPLVLTANYYKHRLNLHQTLEYIYTPEYQKDYDIDKEALSETVEIIKSHKSGQFREVFENKLPYLSTYFNWLVLDNFTLSDAKINRIEHIFLGKSHSESNSRRFGRNNTNQVDIIKLSNSSVYDESQETWRSWVDLEIANYSNINLSEFTASLKLPDGAWISDYYLYVENRKELGILSEKKSAMWVYAQITGNRRDPGILYYQDDNSIAFRVYPFKPGEVRKTGFEILHKEPFNLEISNQSISLGETNSVPKSKENSILEGSDDVIYVSAKEKENLKETIRQPYFHFVIDASLKESVDEAIEKMNQLILDKRYSDYSKKSKVSFVNHKVKTFDINENWNAYTNELNSNSGFFLERAFEKIYFDSYKSSNISYPVIVVINKDISQAKLSNHISQWKFANPEYCNFYSLESNGTFIEYDPISKNPKKSIDTLSFIKNSHSVLEYKLNDNSSRYLPNDNKASIVLVNERLKLNPFRIEEKNWNSGLLLEGKRIANLLHPELSNEDWVEEVKFSFISKIMTPNTAYMVVENEAQKAILKRKQEQFLKANKSLDIGEETLQMSEPNIYILILMFGGFLFLYYRKN